MTTAVHHPHLVWAAAHRMVLLIAVAVLLAAALATSLTLVLTGSGPVAPTVGSSPVDISDTCAQVGPATPC
jgi:hypothetical protein